MPEMLAVGLEATLVIFALTTAFFIAGYGPTRLVTSKQLAGSGLLLIPLVGTAILILGSYLLNLFVDLRIATATLLTTTIGLAVWSVRRDGWWLPRPTTPQLVALVAGFLVLATALLPHLHNRSGAMLGLNIDEDLYVPLAEALKSNTVFMSDLLDGPFQSEYQGVVNRSRGWGFPYLLSIGSILSTMPAFHVYAPLLYLLLAMSVPSVFVFARSGLQVSERTAALAAVLYAIHGLPLWFVSMGFGPHAVSFALFPVAAAVGVVALRDGGWRSLALSSAISAALLVSYFWAILAVYLVVAIALVASLLLFGPQRRATLLRTLTHGLGVIVLGAPGIVWLVMWATPQVADITRDLNGRFGNAWNDTNFANVALAFGLEPYRLIPRDGPVEALLGSSGVATLNAMTGALFWPALILAILGVLTLRGDRRVAISMAVAYTGFMFWIASGAGYQYGHFKNLSYVAFLVVVLMASGLSNVYHANFSLWNATATQELSRKLIPLKRGLCAMALVMTTILGLALIHNTYLSVWWNWQGVGWNVDRRIAHDARGVSEHIPEGARVFFANDLTYSIAPPRKRMSDHLLGFHFPEHQISSWTNRTMSVWLGMLTRNTILGRANAPAFKYENLSDSQYDYLVLNSKDDPRAHGLTESDAIYTTPYWTVYRDTPGQRLTSADLARALQSLDIPAETDVRIGLRKGTLAIGNDVAPSTEPILLGIAAASSGLVHVGSHTVTIAPGLTWITVPVTKQSVLTLRSYDTKFRPHLISAIRLPDYTTGTLTSEHVSRRMLSINVREDDGSIVGSIIAVNPSEAGASSGFNYNEEPRAGWGASHGFWQSSALVPSPSQRIDFDYDPRNRILTESINGQVFPTKVARRGDFTGDFRLSLRISRSYIKELSVPLIDYHLQQNRLSDTQVFPRTYMLGL